ncbi:hypothetical protein SLS55_001993 [Diplodia seriata]|uniref:Apple domain-containing protein n=1 Tax=Diplodia seriata TaxID=420778 RepID=A0ABR3CQW6_9PEZI
MASDPVPTDPSSTTDDGSGVTATPQVFTPNMFGSVATDTDTSSSTDDGTATIFAVGPSSSPTTTDDGGIATAFDVTSSPTTTATATTSPFAYPPGSYQIGSATYYVACEQGYTTDGDGDGNGTDSDDDMSPSEIADAAASIDDYGTCIAYCDTLGDRCSAAMWDAGAAAPCVLLESYREIADQPLGRCYAAKGGPGMFNGGGGNGGNGNGGGIDGSAGVQPSNTVVTTTITYVTTYPTSQPTGRYWRGEPGSGGGRRFGGGRRRRHRGGRRQ